MNNKGSIGLLVFILAIMVVCVVIVGYTMKSAWMDTYQVTGTVRETWIDHTTEGSAYLVRLTDNRMLEVNRNIFYGGSEYNPDILFTDLQDNCTYEFTCWGWQVDWDGIYWYPNIIDYKLIESG